MNDRRGPPAFVPVLTEVLELAEPAAAVVAFVQPAEPAEPASLEPTLDEARLTQQVLADLRVRVDSMLEHRLREALAPLLAQAADDMVEQARTELAATMRDVVARAVALESARQRNRG